MFGGCRTRLSAPSVTAAHRVEGGSRRSPRSVPAAAQTAQPSTMRRCTATAHHLDPLALADDRAAMGGHQLLELCPHLLLLRQTVTERHGLSPCARCQLAQSEILQAERLVRIKQSDALVIDSAKVRFRALQFVVMHSGTRYDKVSLPSPAGCTNRPSSSRLNLDGTSGATMV
jgi:hypothetical protein